MYRWYPKGKAGSPEGRQHCQPCNQESKPGLVLRVLSKLLPQFKMIPGLQCPWFSEKAKTNSLWRRASSSQACGILQIKVKLVGTSIRVNMNIIIQTRTLLVMKESDKIIFCCLVAKSYLTILQPLELQLASLLCPSDFPGKNTGVGCHFFLLGIFPTQGQNPCLLHWLVGSLPLSHQGSPAKIISRYSITAKEIDEDFPGETGGPPAHRCGRKTPIFCLWSLAGVRGRISPQIIWNLISRSGSAVLKMWPPVQQHPGNMLEL